MTVAPHSLVALPVSTPGVIREVRRLALVPTARYEQGMLALAYRLPSGVDAVPGGAPSSDGGGSRQIPDPSGWAGRFVQAVVEVVSQERPVSQLARWTAAGVYAEVVHLQRTAAAGSRDPAVRPARASVASVRVAQLRSDVAEVAARVSAGERSRAVAARLDFQRGRWTCTALALG